MTKIYHLLPAAALAEARARGEYRPASLAREGFIHFSQKHQILGVANAFYREQAGLALLVVETERLRAELRFEAPVHPAGAAAPQSLPAAEALFPHLYGPLNLDAVTQTLNFPANPDGSFSLPPELL
ncbi:MAG: DUF952 domain-containing protein [Anaerolineales bacterium]